MKHLRWLVLVVALLGGGLFMQASPATAKAAVHYIHKWQHPYPVDLVEYEPDSDKPNRAGVYSSKGKLLRRVNAEKVKDNYWPLAEAKIKGHKYYRVYKYSYRPFHEGTHKLVGWMRKSDFTWQVKHLEYASASFYTYTANFSDSKLPNAMSLSDVEGQPVKFKAHAGHSFAYVTSASFALRSYMRESDGNYASTGLDAYRCLHGEMELAYYSQGKGKHTVVKYLKKGQTKHYTIKDKKYGKVPTTIKNNVKGKWLTLSYKVKGKKHTYTITNKGTIRFDGRKIKYAVESTQG